MFVDVRFLIVWLVGWLVRGWVGCFNRLSVCLFVVAVVAVGWFFCLFVCFVLFCFVLFWFFFSGGGGGGGRLV